MPAARTLRSILCLAVVSATAGAAVIIVQPTGVAATDLASVRAAIAAAQPDDVVLLRIRNASGAPTPFNLTGIPSGGILVGTRGITLRGELEESGGALLWTRLRGPTFYHATQSLVAFTALPGADGLSVEKIAFENFEAAVVLESGVRGLAFEMNFVNGCGYGVFGVANNDDLRIHQNVMVISHFPAGGNAAVTTLEGGDRLQCAGNVLVYPSGRGQSALACAGIIDFNLLAPARDLQVSGNLIAGFDIGVYVSSERGTLGANTVLSCGDGVQMVSEIGTGWTQGTQVCRNWKVFNNTSANNVAHGVRVLGAQDGAFLYGVFAPNGGMGVRLLPSSLGRPPSGNFLYGNVGTSGVLPPNVPDGKAAAPARP